MSGITPGNKFGRLTAVRELVPNQLWLCKCECGEWKVCREWGLKSGNVRSCGCLKREFFERPVRKLPDYMNCPIGMRFGRLTVKERVRRGCRHWKCVCECGGEIIASSESLYRGKITHCQGCGGQNE